MPCYHPITAYQSVNPTGKKQIYFGAKPRTIATSKLQFPCNKCIGCRIQYGAEWGMRCFHESMMHEENTFPTFTYADENLPYNHSLYLTHLQTFFKRFRNYLSKEHPGVKISYFISGEYGGETSRPHYHAIIFGFKFPDQEWVSGEKTHKYYTSEIADKLWTHGNVTIADVTPETCNYVARYLLKDLRSNAWKSDYEIADPETGEIHQRKSPFSTMSRRPAIGKSWYEKYKADCFPSGYLIHQGRKTNVPGYYLKLLEQENPEEYQRQTEIRRKALTTNTAKRENKPERLAVRETCKRVQVENLTRNQN